MIITITDHFGDALANPQGDTTSLAKRVKADECEQPASFIIVSKDTMTEILVELAKRGHVVVGEGIK